MADAWGGTLASCNGDPLAGWHIKNVDGAVDGNSRLVFTPDAVGFAPDHGERMTASWKRGLALQLLHQFPNRHFDEPDL